jgi:peptidoglycan/LPS O-acetylase OafA/YrhL
VAASSAVGVEETPDPSSAVQAAQVDSLTGLRGFAALVVVAVHASGRTDFPEFGIHGYGPVSLFVLSGFLLYRPWSRWALRLGKRPAARTFARRRLLRIFPAYLVVMLAFCVMLPASQPNGWDGWLRAFTLTGTFASDGLRPGFEQTWSLGTELSWYVALPFLGLLAGLVAHRLSGRRAFYSVVGLLALSVPVTVLWRIWVEVEDLGKEFTYSFWLPGFLICFAAGAAVSHFAEGEKVGLVDLSRLRGWFAYGWVTVLLMVVVAGIGTSPLGGPVEYVPASFSERQIRFGASTLLAVLLLLACVLSRPGSLLVRFMATRVMTATGRWSYGIYLWHLPVIVLLEDDFVHRTGVGGFFLWMACIFAV